MVWTVMFLALAISCRAQDDDASGPSASGDSVVDVILDLVRPLPP